MLQVIYSDCEFVGNFIKNPTSFFRGEEVFFYRDRDRDSHLYEASMSLLLGGYVNKSQITMDEFIAGFSSFISSLNDTHQDFYHFLCNILAFNLCIYDNKEINSDLFLCNGPLYKVARQYLFCIDEDFTKQGFFDEIDKGAEPFFAIEKFYPQSGGYLLLKKRLGELGISSAQAAS